MVEKRNKRSEPHVWEFSTYDDKYVCTYIRTGRDSRSYLEIVPHRPIIGFEIQPIDPKLLAILYVHMYNIVQYNDFATFHSSSIPCVRECDTMRPVFTHTGQKPLESVFVRLHLRFFYYKFSITIYIVYNNVIANASCWDCKRERKRTCRCVLSHSLGRCMFFLCWKKHENFVVDW